MLSRVAASVYWMSRYIERAENVARVVGVNNQLVLDKIQGQPEFSLEFRREAGHGQEVIRYMRHFEECLREDKRPLIDEVAGAKVIATASACWESIHTGLPAKVAEVS